MKKYDHFLVPTQVKFWDYSNGRYKGGIAYRNEIICGCCGGVFNIRSVGLGRWLDMLDEGH